MKAMQFRREEIIAKMKENRANHRGIYEEAMEAFRKKAVAALTERLDRAKKGEVVLRFDLVMPEDHTDEYDTAIAMLEMTTDNVITLEAHEFREFVLDEWDWQRAFKMSASSNTGKRY